MTNLEIVEQKQHIKKVSFYDEKKERIFSNIDAGD
jgi:hypothetical protein